jgi:hypothetical protein
MSSTTTDLYGRRRLLALKTFESATGVTKKIQKTNGWGTLQDKDCCILTKIPWNNSIQFFIIYVPSQQLQGQLQTHHSVDTNNYIMDKHYIKSKTN